ncbi:hypothetical protein F9C07_11863 [Aspergillus flavus]|uniref:Uncharacterized protein n=1 Tax=Aspergillus flavus (strain ATCC 200026 / FGSC A1120 / IAM 13836 / NRRL 3357 / JCM 12722 / SRRC 167) TaxID=332952 RepID=A0A7U2N2Z5_ASPFN|nr:hypothetical protein F9C07_11863 [Aspergillus flavus]
MKRQQNADREDRKKNQTYSVNSSIFLDGVDDPLPWAGVNAVMSRIDATIAF